ncbi:hypothetical protein [Paramaledivibacter caminithermalis]|jgi:ABC-type transport system involved in multi-copper enzyme maturation permease subunit|uniref:ABC-2 family transporter protein n=1 Tax=Paramaledivibacter caminithermalis (strain DSM 15212 / CIP 107654 / DViRD3) TaxID=1121301 RepID=A0A1M6SB84_PARC5|nr:hypothetical protein [Paramaledivibacter caminithermalis]SHK42043.1 hypothetical protein SAMN02745912_03255 [Paramaledivibacter caminithermalis DSM 15212]
MLNVVLVELKKIFKMQLVRLVFIFGLIFSLFSLLFWLNHEGPVSAFSIPVSTLNNLTQTLVIVIFVGFTGYIYGVEIQSKTLKIIKAKNIPDWKVLAYKYIAAFITILIFILFIGIFIFSISTILFPLLDFHVKYDSELIMAEKGLISIFLAYIFEAVPLFFVACLCLTITIFLNSAVLGIISTFFFFILCKLAESISMIKIFLPSYHILIWQDIVRAEPNWSEIGTKVAITAGYCVLLYMLALLFYQRKEVKD